MPTAERINVEHPGFFIREELAARGWKQVDLAYILGMSSQQLSPLLNGKRDITPETAIALGDAFGVSPEFFANLQKLFDLSKAKRPDPGVKTRANWVKTFPIREMIQRKWIEDTEADLLNLQMKRFFSAENIEDIPFVGNAEVEAHAAKKSDYEEITPIQLVWLQRVRLIAKTMDIPEYRKENLLSALPIVRAHMADIDDISMIPEILTDCGVRVVFVEALSGSKIDGVCTWIDDQPVIGITARLNRMDNFCFVLRHEIEHILNGDGKERYSEHVDVFDPDHDIEGLPDEEKIANRAAAEFLVPQDMLSQFMRRKGRYISERDVLSFAARHSIHPSIVIGQIQRRRYEGGDENAFRWLRRHLIEVREYFDEWKYLDGWGRVADVNL